MSELTPSEELALIEPDCYECGSTEPSDYTDTEAQEVLDARTLCEATEHGRRLNASISNLRYLCPQCLANHDGRDVAQRRQVHIDTVWRNTYGRNLMPMSSRHQTFADSTPEIEERNMKAWTWARSWKPASGNAWIFGLVGRGKTFLARCIAMAQLVKGFTVGEIDAIQWCDKAGNFAWQEHRERLADVHLLIFEDIDKAIWKAQSFEALWRLINTRYESKRRTIVTSNGAPEFMLQNKWPKIQGNSSMTHALAERLMPCQRWELTGESLRRSER